MSQPIRDVDPDELWLPPSRASGCNAVRIDMALEARRLGMWVAALTSTAHANASTARHESEKKLHEVADLVLDQQAPAGDSAVWIDGLETPVSLISSATGCAIIKLVKADVARLLTEAGAPLTVFTAACHLGADRARRFFKETCDDSRRRIGVLYR
jgi:uncharacterized phosphosugar-binding protein